MTANGDSLRAAVEKMHKCRATFRRVVRVHEAYGGETVWEGEVSVFDLEGHPTATICYAWANPIEGSDRQRFYAILHAGPVESAADAVRAAIAEEYHRGENP